MGKVFLIVTAIFFFVGIIPMTSSCAYPGAVCSSAPDVGGNVSHYVEIQPMAMYVLESLLKSDLGITYDHYYEIVKVNQ